MRRDAAAVLAASGVIAAQLLGRWNSPTNDHPRTKVWYRSLRKPPFMPPAAVFGIVWTGLDAALGYSGYRLLSAPRRGRRTAAIAAWGLNLVGVAGFPLVMFGRKRLGEATGVTAGLVATAFGGVVAASAVDRRASLAGVPLALWVCFAFALQEEMWRRNG